MCMCVCPSTYESCEGGISEGTSHIFPLLYLVVRTLEQFVIGMHIDIINEKVIIKLIIIQRQVR